MNKYEMHSHTSECDLVAKLSGAELVRRYAEVGYSGIVITDHYFSTFYEWFADELSGADHKKFIDLYLRGYHSAREEGEKLGFTVLSGSEVRFDNVKNDYLVYGLEERDFYELPRLNKLKGVKELIEALPDYAVVVQAHPFRNNMVVKSPKPLFGIEAYNGGTDAFRNEMARIYAEHYGKAMTSGSDIHDINALAKGGIATERKILCSRDLVETLRSGEYSLIRTDENK